MPSSVAPSSAFFFFVVVGPVAVGVAAALAFARGKPIGTGVVVIDTNLGYQGGAAAGSGMVLTSSGTVLTNNHVIAGATTIKVVVPNRGTATSRASWATTAPRMSRSSGCKAPRT